MAELPLAPSAKAEDVAIGRGDEGMPWSRRGSTWWCVAAVVAAAVVMVMVLV